MYPTNFKKKEMKKYLVIGVLLVASLQMFGQKSSVNVQLNSGMTRFYGESAEATEIINYNLEKEDGYTNNPYGSKFGLSYGASVGYTRTSRTNIRFGLDVGYEVLRSKISIDGVWLHGGMIDETVPAEGWTYMNLNFMNIYPRVGYEFASFDKIITLDFGVDYGYCLKATEKGYAETTTREFETERDRTTIRTDFRPRVQIGIARNRIGAYFGYSVGVVNYKSAFVGGSFRAYTNVVRVGVNFKLYQ